MRIRLDFTVCENGLPAVITVRSFDGRLILYKKIYFRQNSLCFCSRSRNIIITVRPINSDYYEKSYFIKLDCRPCHYLRLNFEFSEIGKGAIQEFYLYDENYLFPIPSAGLRFYGY